MAENPAFLGSQLIACRGNKRKLLDLLAEGLGLVRKRLGKRKYRILDAFSGSGVCSRFFKQYADLLIANDLQPYAATVSSCFLANRSAVDFEALRALIDDLEAHKLDEVSGFIQDLYTPVDEESVQPGERFYYTRANARILDGTCQRLAGVDEKLRTLVLGPLLAEAMFRSNTAGHFKSFLKDRNTGLGRLGGTADARAERMRAPITIQEPVLSEFECECRVLCENVDDAAFPDLDVAYFDPPYDTESYGALYWMLNLLVNYERPTRVSRVAGVPHDWLRSNYSRRRGVLELLDGLIGATPARFIMLSYSNESQISQEQITGMLEKHGTFKCLERRHRRFNSANTSTKHGTRGTRYARPQVIERLYVLQKR